MVRNVVSSPSRTHFDIPLSLFVRSGTQATIGLWTNLRDLLSTQGARDYRLMRLSSHETLAILSCLATSRVHSQLDCFTLHVYHFFDNLRRTGYIQI